MHTSPHVYILQTVHCKLHIYVAYVQYEHANVLWGNCSYKILSNKAHTCMTSLLYEPMNAFLNSHFLKIL